jgi:Na+/phosphate symporter
MEKRPYTNQTISSSNPGGSIRFQEQPADTTPTRPVDGRISVSRWVLLRQLSWYKAPLFFISIFLFILAITLMKEGAKGLIPLMQDGFQNRTPANSLGFGWLFAYLIMSGSPVAASALTFLDAGVLDALSAFTMITGSRLGASFIVLFIGFIYVLRGRNRAVSLDMGLLSLIVTASTHIPALFLGAFLLEWGILDSFQLSSGVLLTGLMDAIFDPIAAFFLSFLPQLALFVVGLVIIMISFSLFDRCLPQMSLKESHVGRMSRLVYRPSIMFLLGAGLTLISMSVSVSLSLLVPLSARGFVRRENVIPYIMGAGVTTFIDTLFAAVLLTDPQAFTVVLVEMAAVTLVSLLLLATIFRWYEHWVLRSVAWTTANNRNLTIFMVIIFVVPIVLLIF